MDNYSEDNLIENIYKDCRERRKYFEDIDLPEENILSKYEEDSLEILTYGCMLDYNRSASMLWSNIEDLYEENHKVFYPEYIVNELGKDKLTDLMQKHNFRYSNRDSKGWFENSQIICDDYGGEWKSLIECADKDGPKLYDVIKKENFKYLSGKKLCPFYVKSIHTHYSKLSNIWSVPIAVDVHVRRVTKKISHEKLDNDDDVREYWRKRGEEGVDPTYIDTALWLIGNNWNEWGEKYLKELKDVC